MAMLTISLPPPRTRTAFNLRRWKVLSADSELARIEGRIETDRHGQIIMGPPPVPRHGSLQSEIAYLLRTLVPHGRVLTECPISTSDGVKAADVAWASTEFLRELGKRSCFPRCPELCVEVTSPANTEMGVQEKVALYFEAGAAEVWLCSPSGAVKFLTSATARPRKTSRLCPRFPRQVKLR